MAKLMKDPVYKQLSDALRGHIREHSMAAGEKFLTEREISERFGVSRATSNKALAALVGEGVLEFRKGIGTFIRQRALEYDLQRLVSFTEKAIAAGKVPSSKILSFKKIPAVGAENDVESHLCIEPAADGQLWYIERLRLADCEPAILERRHIPVSICPELTEKDVEGSLYSYLSEKMGLDISGAKETIRAVNITGSDAVCLGVAEGEAGLLVTAVGYLSDESPVWFEQTLYRGDRYEFRNQLGGIEAGCPAVGDLL